MSRFEQELRNAIHEGLKEVGTSSRVIPRLTPGAIRRRQVAKTILAGTAVVALGVGAFLASQFLPRTTPEASRSARTAGDQNQIGSSLGADDVTPEMSIAGGTHDQTEWSLIAYETDITGGHLAGKHALCSALTLGSDAPNVLCDVTVPEQLTSGSPNPQPIALWEEDFTAVYGPITSEVADVRLELENGTTTMAQKHAAPLLGPSVRFFVAFVPAKNDIKVVSLNDSGVVLDAKNLDALPRLTVESVGAGTGTVQGHETCESCPQPPEMVVDCGSDCWTEFEASGGSVTLKAIPAAGSDFLGWSGACTGTDSKCVVVSATDVSVRATFEPAR